MPGSNERSIQVTGEVDQVCECARSFLDDISKVGGSHMYIYVWCSVHVQTTKPVYPCRQ